MLNMFPTGVGMNRQRRVEELAKTHVPHGRGDEPLTAIGEVYNGDMTDEL